MEDVYYYLIVLFALIFATPFVVCTYREYLASYITKIPQAFAKLIFHVPVEKVATTSD